MIKMVGAALKLLLIGCLGVMLVACAVPSRSDIAGNEQFFDPAFLNAHLIKDKTTTAEAIAVFGEPDRKTQNSNNETTLKYVRKSSGSMAGNMVGVIPVVGPVFDSAGKLINPGRADAGKQMLEIKFVNDVYQSWEM